MFIYPTKTGALSFDRHYLGRVLDPLLRKLMVLNQLPQNVLWKIRNMASIPYMSDFPRLQARLEGFCKEVTNGIGDIPKMPTKMVYSAKATVVLNELSWREWWAQQEQLRIREIVKIHMANRQAPPGSKTAKGKETDNGFWHGYGVPGDLAREILDGIRAPSVRPSSRGMANAVLDSSMGGGGSGTAGPCKGVEAASIAGGTEELEAMEGKGVEVGIFILRRGLDY